MDGSRPLISGVLVDLAAIGVIGLLGFSKAIEGRDAATAILVIVVGRLRPPSDALPRNVPPSPGGIITILAALGAVARGRFT